ncbi:DegQ family serine endoprotease [Rhodanobacter sp. L36]|uniref:DegQ family serine endoprotease n=1 Tax=Rhodanobacter sp. L36 TaxID=1747221 RepID=UPI00131D35F8|nr:DegQ family serine endoprotease [Rhodanobacter sp. L36]
MRRSILRTVLCSALLACFSVGALQAQTAPAASLPDFTGIVQKNAPAVVHVEAKYTGERQRSQQKQGMPGQGMPNDQQEILRRFFGMPMMPSPEEQKHTSVGSGFILSTDGFILTNNHVVDGADKVTVRLQDRRTLTAKVIGTDPTYDIAVLKVDAGGSLPAVTIGDSHSLKPGQWVLAIGSPFGFDYTVTQGIVSAVGRNLGEQDQRYTSFIQTDVPINRGNSGGPLFNLQGQVVGINSQIYSNTGDYTGVSFSIPIDVAMNAVQQIKSGGHVTRGQLGVTVGPLTDDIVKGLKLDNNNGAIVSDVSPGSGAEKAGLRAGDVILRFNGETIGQSADLPPLVGMTKPGTKATVDIVRNGKRQAVEVVVGAAPRDGKGESSDDSSTPSAKKTSQAVLGLSVQEPDADARQQSGLKAGEGVEISDITGATAANAGLQQGDIILMVGQQRIGSVAAFHAATQSAKPGDTLLLLVRRGDQSSFIGLTVPSDK